MNGRSLSHVIEGHARSEKPVRLMGLGVRFQSAEVSALQLEWDSPDEKAPRFTLPSVEQD